MKSFYLNFTVFICIFIKSDFIFLVLENVLFKGSVYREDNSDN